MGEMKKQSNTETDIVIQWRCTCDDKAACHGNHTLPREDVLELASALGRLAARRDRARAAVLARTPRLSSARKLAKVTN